MLTLMNKLFSSSLLRRVAPSVATRQWTAGCTQQAHQHKGFGVCFDVDGVLIQGQYVLPEAREAFKLLTDGRKFKYPVLFVTNSSAKDSDKAAMLSDAFNIDITTDHIVHAQSPLTLYTHLCNKHVVVLGQGDLRGKAADVGLRNISTLPDITKHFPLLDVTSHSERDRPDASKITDTRQFPQVEGLVLMGEPANWGAALQISVDILLTNGNLNSSSYSDVYDIDLIACNPDLLYKHKAELPRFGQGAFLRALEALYEKSSGRQLTYTSLLGKPSEVTYSYAEHRIHEMGRSLNQPITCLYMIGDNPCSDIAGANLYHNYVSQNRPHLPLYRQPPVSHAPCSDRVTEVQSLLVCTGVYRKETQNDLTLNHSHRDFPLTKELITPTKVCPTVLEAVQYLLQRH